MRPEGRHATPLVLAELVLGNVLLAGGLEPNRQAGEAVIVLPGKGELGQVELHVEGHAVVPTRPLEGQGGYEVPLLWPPWWSQYNALSETMHSYCLLS